MYGAAKLAAAILTERLCDLGGVNHSWLRVFSTYGQDDNPDWMIPSLIRQLGRGVRPALTAGEQCWDYLYVDDAAAAFEAVAKTRLSGIFNLGSGEAIPLRGLIERIRDIIDPSLDLGFGEIPYRPDQVIHLQANIDKLKANTAWAPETPLEKGLSDTIRWFNSPQA
jgi:UDP-glucose 4-epimerase